MIQATAEFTDKVHINSKLKVEKSFIILSGVGGKTIQNPNDCKLKFPLKLLQYLMGVSYNLSHLWPSHEWKSSRSSLLAVARCEGLARVQEHRVSASTALWVSMG